MPFLWINPFLAASPIGMVIFRVPCILEDIHLLTCIPPLHKESRATYKHWMLQDTRSFWSTFIRIRASYMVLFINKVYYVLYGPLNRSMKWILCFHFTSEKCKIPREKKKRLGLPKVTELISGGASWLQMEGDFFFMLYLLAPPTSIFSLICLGLFFLLPQVFTVIPC